MEPLAAATPQLQLCRRNQLHRIINTSNGAYSASLNSAYFVNVLLIYVQEWMNTSPLTFQLTMRVHYKHRLWKCLSGMVHPWLLEITKNTFYHWSISTWVLTTKSTTASQSKTQSGVRIYRVVWMKPSPDIAGEAAEYYCVAMWIGWSGNA